MRTLPTAVSSPEDGTGAGPPPSRRGRRRVRPSGNPPETERAFHGRRKGRPLHRADALLVETLLPRLAIDLSVQPLDLARLFPRRVEDVRLEIGFGAGDHLAAEAKRHQDIGFIGCEPFLNGLAKALRLLDEAGLDNVRVHPGEAQALIDALPPASLGGVDLLYPDPWPKRRQRKRRFVSDLTLSRLARVMRPGAELRFATDIDDYAGWTLARVLRSRDFTWRAERAGDWTQPWEGWAPTRYEAKAHRAGRRSAYLTFVRTEPCRSASAKSRDPGAGSWVPLFAGTSGAGDAAPISLRRLSR